MMKINKGYVLAAFAYTLYAISDAISKYFIPDYGYFNVMFVHSTARFIPFIFWVIFVQQNPYKTKKFGANVLRACFATAAGYALLAGYKYSPMTDVAIVGQSSSIIIIPLSMYFLHEKNKYAIGAIFLGFLGVLCAFRPTGDIFQIGVAFALLSAICNAFNRVLVKKLSITDSELTMIFYYQTLTTFFAIIFADKYILPFHVMLMLTFGGFISGTALYILIHSYKYAECTHIASAAYTMFIAATVIDIAVYNKVPDKYIILGGVFVIIGSVIANYPQIRRKCAKQQGR